MTETLQYREILPPPSLRLHVKCIWRLYGPRPDFVAAEPIVPDGCVELVLNLGDRFVRHTAGALLHRQPARIVAGQITRAVHIEPSGRVDLWGIRFHPWSAAAFLGLSGDELRDRFLSLDEAIVALDDSFSRLEEREDDDARYDAILSVLSSRAAGVTLPDTLLPDLVALAERHHEPLSVRGLARHAGLSTRRVQSLFRDGVGLSPKQLLRISRFQRALGLARAQPDLSWSAIAARAGYYDQAHLIHDSNDIAGCTPSALLGRDAVLTDAFLSD
ncbi:MAG TPA: helix-turn-helix domain-containing protein [Gemmatimonadaceae bacterium]